MELDKVGLGLGVRVKARVGMALEVGPNRTVSWLSDKYDVYDVHGPQSHRKLAKCRHLIFSSMEHLSDHLVILGSCWGHVVILSSGVQVGFRVRQMVSGLSFLSWDVDRTPLEGMRVDRSWMASAP